MVKYASVLKGCLFMKFNKKISGLMLLALLVSACNNVGTSSSNKFSSSSIIPSVSTNSSNSVLINEANESERLKENKDKEPLQEVYNFKGFELSTASESEKEIHINSNIESNNTPPVSPCSEKEAGCSAARPQQQKEPGMDMSEYIELCFAKGVSKLADMRRCKLPQDNNLFWRTVDYYCDLYGYKDKSIAAKNVSKIVAEFIKQDIN